MGVQAIMCCAAIAASPFTGGAITAGSAGLLRLRGLERPAFRHAAVVVAAFALSAASFEACVAAIGAVDPLYCIWAGSGMFLAAVISLCDISRRVIPWSLCAALAFCGMTYQYVVNGWGYALSTAVFGFVAWGLCALLCAVLPEGALGGGDVYALPSIVTYIGTGPILGSTPLALSAVAASVCAIAVLLILLALKKLDRGDAVPFGPFFSLWATFGAITPAASLAFG